MLLAVLISKDDLDAEGPKYQKALRCKVLLERVAREQYIRAKPQGAWEGKKIECRKCKKFGVEFDGGINPKTQSRRVQKMRKDEEKYEAENKG